MKKRVFALVFALALIWGVCTAAEEEISYGNQLAGVLRSSDGVSDVNVRTQPSMDAPLLGVYRSGVRADAFERVDGWLQVSIGGDEQGSVRGYVLEKVFSTQWQSEGEAGFPVKQLSDAQDSWDFAQRPWAREAAPALRHEDGALELGTSGWPQLAAGVRCVALGEVENGEWTHVRMGLDRYGFIPTRALEETGLSSLSAARIPRMGIAAVHPGTPYAMPVYAYTDDSTALWATLREGDTLEYIAHTGKWVQVAIANMLECAFVPAEYVTLYPYEMLYAVDAVYSAGVHEIEQPGLYTFSCVGGGRLEIVCEAYTRIYEGSGMYSMYLPRGAQVTVTDGILAGISTDKQLEDLSRNGVGAWDESRGNGRYLAGVHMASDLWRDKSYIVTVEEGKECGYYRIETLDQDAGAYAQSEWTQLKPGDVIDLNLYYGQFIELRDAILFYFSGNG